VRFVTHRVGKRTLLRGVQVSGGRVMSLSLSRGNLVIRLFTATRGMTVKISSRAVKESSALRRKAEAHQLRTLVLTLITTNTAGKRTTVRVRFTIPGDRRKAP
jgi:hypothetical protein